MRQDSAAASARPTRNASAITRLNLAFKPIGVPCRRGRSTAAHEAVGLLRGEPPGHIDAQLMLIAADRSAAVHAEDAVDLAAIVAQACQRGLDTPAVGVGHLFVG